MATVDAVRMAESRAKARALEISSVFDPIRRRDCEADDEEWLRVYCPDVFYNPFTPHQSRIIQDCRESLLFGTQKCKAAPRGDGKSSIIKYLTVKYVLRRQVKFPLIVASTSSKAKKTLNSLKRRLAAKVDTPFQQDYPLECTVARYVDPWPSRARNVIDKKKRPIHVEWCADWFVLPTWEDEEPLGPILLSLGVTSDELQGCNIYDQRPDWVLLDDLDSRDSLASEDGVVAGKIEEIVDKSIAGLGGQSRRLGKFMLCTITSRDSAAFKYSDPTQKPSWSGERVPAIINWPERSDLWEQYIEYRKYGKQTRGDDGRPVDPFGRQAHQLYQDNREAMDSGAVLSNPYNFESGPLPDGSPKQLSALQRCYDYIADENMESFLTEYQNDPPEDEGLVESGISPQLIAKQLSGFEQGEVPPDCNVLVQGVDVGKKWFHWVVRAFRLDGTGFTIDYGRQEVFGTKYGSDEGVDRAVRRAIIARMDEFREMPYAKAFRESLTLFDSGYRTEAVYAGCIEAGMGVMPVKGIGLSVRGSGSFADVMRRTMDKQPICDGIYYSTIREPGMKPIRLVCASADQWKAWDHDRWMTAVDRPGCMFLWGKPSDDPRRRGVDERAHEFYAHQSCAEVEVEEVKDEQIRRRWKAMRKDNHWQDANYYADVAAAIKGVRVLMENVAKPVDPSKRPTMAQLAGRV